MARARNIKPSIMDNEELAELGALHRLLFIYLWMLADREGRLEDRPKRIAAQALPYDRSADVNAMLGELKEAGFLARYKLEGVAVIQVLAFAKHQTPHMRESASTLPAQVLSTTKAVHEHNQGSAETSPRPSDTGYLIPDTGLSDSTPAGAGHAPVSSSKAEYPEDFEQVWTVYPQRPGASKADSFKAWKARIKDGVCATALIDGVRRYAAYCKAAETEPQFVKQPATFFGPGEHFTNPWTPPARAAPKASSHKHAAAAAAIFEMDDDCQHATRPAEDYIDV